jgi:N-acetylmuramoyl-L-alanine amidase
VVAQEPQVAKTDPARKVVVLDPGHGGEEIGASANGVVEKMSNLDMALRVERLLLAQGFDVVLTRRSDARATASIPGYTATRVDLQARLDAANAAGGDVFVSLHSNGSPDPSQRGVEAWYDSSRGAFAQESYVLAGMLVENVLSELRIAGYTAQDRGLFDGKCFRMREGRCFTLFVVAGPRETTREDVIRRGGDPAALGFGDREAIFSRPANMPAALLELLLITNPQDAAILLSEAARDAMARGVANAIAEFLASFARGN